MMNKNKNCAMMNFNGMNVEVLELDGKVLFNAKHVAECLEIKNVNDAINNFNQNQVIKLNNSAIGITDIRKFNNAGENFLTESGVYKLIFKSRKPEAEKFQDWVTDVVLPEIRQNGMYISDMATDEQKQYNFKMLDVTFKNCSVELLEDKYKECMDYHTDNKTRLPYKANTKKRSDATHTHNDSKIMVMKRIEKALENRMSGLITDNRFGLVSEINNVIKLIKDDITKQYNLSNRGKIGGKTKQIKALMEQVG